MSNQPRQPGRFSNVAIGFYLVLWTILTVPFIGKWSFALPIGLAVWVLWKANQMDREQMRQAAEQKLAEHLSQSGR